MNVVLVCKNFIGGFGTRPSKQVAQRPTGGNDTKNKRITWPWRCRDLWAKKPKKSPFSFPDKHEPGAKLSTSLHLNTSLAPTFFDTYLLLENSESKSGNKKPK